MEAGGVDGGSRQDLPKRDERYRGLVVRPGEAVQHRGVLGVESNVHLVAALKQFGASHTGATHDQLGAPEVEAQAASAREGYWFAWIGVGVGDSGAGASRV